MPSHVTVSSVDDFRKLIREVPDFPKPGIRFYDITTLLKDADAFREVIDRMADQVGDAKVDVVVGMESRGFIFSAPLAYQLGAGFVPVRKLGKLPAETIEVEYDSNTARPRSRFTPMPSARASAYSSSTTCWRPAVR